MNKTVVAVTVTYNPSTDILKKQIESLSSQCPLILVDNGSHGSALSAIERVLEGYQEVTLEKLGSNTGIAAAQNHGVARARNLYPECQHVLTLDHDSVPDFDMVIKLLACYSRLGEAEQKVAAVGPLLYDKRSGSYLNFHRIKGVFWWKVTPVVGGPPIQVDSLNSSGSMISIEALDTAGGFNEQLFIDHVETEWCFRAIDAGYSIYACQENAMEHAMGDDIVKMNFFNIKSMPYRSPKRHYFIFRNSLFLQRQKYVPGVWKFWNAMKLTFTLLYFGLFTKEAKQHRFWIYRGFRDGWYKRLGDLPSI